MQVDETPPVSAQDLGPCSWDRTLSQFSHNQRTQLLVNELVKSFDKFSVKYIWEKCRPSVTVCRHEKRRNQSISTKLQIKH